LLVRLAGFPVGEVSGPFGDPEAIGIEWDIRDHEHAIGEDYVSNHGTGLLGSSGFEESFSDWDGWERGFVGATGAQCD